MDERFIPLTETVRALPATTPFVGPEALERTNGAVFKARIGANESAFGPSPKALAAMRDAVAEASWYGDPENFELRQAIAAHHGVGMDNVCVAAGIDSLLGLVVRMLVSPGAPIVTSLGAYPTFNYQVSGFGGALHTVPYRNDFEDPEALLDKAKAVEAPLLYVANPDNPMGSWHGAASVQSLIDSVPTGKVLILDEAYADFLDPVEIPAIDVSNPCVIRMRTFSKAHGLAGARVGYAIAHPALITGLNKIRNQFEVTRVSQAGALAAFQDPQYVGQVVAEVAAGKADIAKIASKHGFTALPSATNFVAIDVGGHEQATRMMAELGRRGVFIRMPGAAPLNRCIRVTVGTEKDRAVFADALADVVASGG